MFEPAKAAVHKITHNRIEKQIAKVRIYAPTPMYKELTYKELESQINYSRTKFRSIELS
jgi:hypothetical protein